MNLIPDAYLGRPYNEVRSTLVGMGLQVIGEQVFNDAPAGTVTNIEPSGPVNPGQAITVTYSKGPDPSQESQCRQLALAALNHRRSAPSKTPGCAG